MERSIIKRNSAKASTAKRLDTPLHEDKSFGLDPDTRLYLIEDGDNTEEGEDAEILIIHD